MEMITIIIALLTLLVAVFDLGYKISKDIHHNDEKDTRK